MKKIGIYQIKNIKNNKIYIGQSMDVEDRIKNHLKQLKSNKHKNYKLQEEFNSYGEHCFQASVLEECEPHLLTRREGILCHENEVWDNKKGYNIGKLLDYRRLSEEEAIYYKDLILHYIHNSYRSGFYKAKTFCAKFQKETIFFDLDFEQISISMHEITNEDKDKYKCFIQWDYFNKTLTFHPYDKDFASKEYLFANLDENINEEKYINYDFFKEHKFKETKYISDEIFSLSEYENSNTNEIKQIEIDLIKKQAYNLEKIMSLTDLNNDYKAFFIETFTNEVKKYSSKKIDFGLVDLLEPLLEEFLYEDDGKCGLEFIIYLHSHPIFEKIRDISK